MTLRKKNLAEMLFRPLRVKKCQNGGLGLHYFNDTGGGIEGQNLGLFWRILYFCLNQIGSNNKSKGC